MTEPPTGTTTHRRPDRAAGPVGRLPGCGPVGEHGPVLTVPVAEEQLPDALAAALRIPGARFADAFATAGPPLTLRTVVALDRDARYLILTSELRRPTMPWLSDVTPAAFVEECELFEQFGLRPPAGHRLNRLAAVPTSAPDQHQLSEVEAPARDTHLPYTVGGHAFEFPVGPVQSTAVESLYYGLVTSGEEVVDLYLHTWHKYRGIERRLRGLSPDRALFYVERGEGLSAASTSAAFAMAVESALGVAPPQEAWRDRAICVELERLYNHAQCAVALAAATGLWIGQSQAELATELLLRLNAAVAGHRYLFGAVGIDRSPGLRLDRLRELLPAAHRELRGVLDALLDTNSFLDRLEATGVIAPQRCAELGLVGPIARACGQGIDTRVDHPGGGQVGLASPAVRETGDCLARLLVRSAEVDDSVHALERLAAGDAAGRPEPAGGGLEPTGWGLGVAESPRGETLAWVQLDPDGRIERARLRTASGRDWRAFDDAVRSQNVFTDVPIIEASFWLTVAGRML